MIWASIEDVFQGYMEDLTSLDNHKTNILTSLVMFSLSSLLGYTVFSAHFFERASLITITLASSTLLTLVFAILIFLYPRMQMDTARRSIDDNLLTTTSYMSVLASSGMSIERIMEKVAVIEKTPEIQKEVQIFLTDIKLFGKPVTLALDEMAHRTRKSSLSKMLTGIINTVNTSGDISNYLSYETKHLIKLKEEETKNILTKLAYMGEIYIAALVVGPILFIIMLSLLSGMEINTGFSSMTLLNSMVFIGIPILSLGYLIFLDNILGGSG